MSLLAYQIVIGVLLLLLLGLGVLLLHMKRQTHTQMAGGGAPAATGGVTLAG